MDNLAPGFPSQVFMAALRDTLGDKPLQWVATADIGHFALLSFESPEKYNHKAIGLAGDELTSPELDQSFKNKTTQGMAGTFWAFGAVLRLLIGELRTMIDWFAAEGFAVLVDDGKTELFGTGFKGDLEELDLTMLRLRGFFTELAWADFSNGGSPKSSA